MKEKPVKEPKRTESTTKDRQAAEKARLMTLFPDASPALMTKAEPLIDRLAFLSVSLAELEETMRQSGLIEEYTNGANQSGVKASAASQVYNNFLKSYAQLHGKLMQLIPYQRETDGGTDPVQEDPEEEEAEQYDFESFRTKIAEIHSADPETAKQNELRNYIHDQQLMLDRGVIDRQTYNERLKLFELTLNQKYAE